MPERAAAPDWLQRLGRFGAVGLVGFAVDAGVVYALKGWLGLYAAALLSFLVAASGNWLLNRIWTFRGRGGGTALRQYLSFMAANGLGFLANRGVLFALALSVPWVLRHLIVGVAAGTLAGLGLNFTLSHRYVFRSQ